MILGEGGGIFRKGFLRPSPRYQGFHLPEAFFQGAQGLLVFQEHGQDHGFQGPGVGGVHPGLEVQAGQFKEPVQVDLVLAAQGQ